MYIKLKGSNGVSGSEGLLVTRAVWAPMKESNKNMNVPQNSPKMMTIAFLMRSRLGLPTRRSATACSVGKPVMLELAREAKLTIVTDLQRGQLVFVLGGKGEDKNEEK
jgi:hypothetical protein